MSSPDDAIAASLARYHPDTAADLLAAAEPLMAVAWDEGADAALDALNRYIKGEPYKLINPYRKPPATEN